MSRKYGRAVHILVTLTMMCVLGMNTVNAESWGFDTMYQQGLSSSSRDSSTYIPMNPKGVNAVPVTVDDVTVPEGMREERTGHDQIYSGVADNLSLNGARIVESLYFKNGSMELDESFLDGFGTNYQTVMMPGIVKGFDGSYVQIQVVDFSNGINISNLFRSDNGELLDILELNPGGHGYEIVCARESADSGWNFYILPVTPEPGQLELLINDNLTVVFKPLGVLSIVPIKMKSDIEILFSSMDNGRIIEEPDWMDDIFERDEIVGESEEDNWTSDEDNWTADDEWGEVPDEFTNPSNYIDPTGELPALDEQMPSGTGTAPVDNKVPNGITLKKGGEERYAALINEGIDSATALSIVIEEGYLETNTSEADRIRREQQQNENIDDFFKDMGIGNVNTDSDSSQSSSSSSSSSSSGSSSTSYYDSWLQESTSNTTKTNTKKRTVDTTGIDLNPMIWGIASKDASTYGEVALDGNSLIKEWTDTYTVDITSLSGKAHEYVMKKAVRPSRIVAIQPTAIKVKESSFLLSAALILGAVGLVVIYLMVVNTYIIKVRKRIKMAEIDGMKSSGISSIGDLDSFEISS